MHRIDWKRVPWFTAFGSATLFASVIAQNYFGGRWTQERSRLEYIQTQLTIEEVKATQWRLVLKEELRRVPPDNGILVEAANFYAQHSAVLTSLAVIRAEGSAAASQELYQAQVGFTNSIHEAAARSDMPLLMNHIESLERFNAVRAPGLMKEATELYATVVTREAKWAGRFLALYIFGSIAIGIGVTRSWSLSAAGAEGAPNPRVETNPASGRAAHQRKRYLRGRGKR